jgi:hypothetical protein
MAARPGKLNGNPSGGCRAASSGLRGDARSVDRAEKRQNGRGREVWSLRLRVVASVWDHDDVCVQGLSDPVGFGARVREVGVVSAHHNQRGL